MAEKQETQVQDRYAITEVAASYEPAIQDNVSALTIQFQDAWVLILNKLDKIEKAVA